MSSRVFVALRVAAGPQRAFDVFTGQIGDWWRPSPIFATTPRAPGRLMFEVTPEGWRLVEILASGKVFEIGRVLAWEPPDRLVFSWRQASFPPELHTEVEVRFEAVGTETCVSVEHRGFDRVPQASAARHGFPDPVLLNHLASFWRGQLDALAGVNEYDCPGS